jgi:hypothetical protein
VRLAYRLLFVLLLTLTSLVLVPAVATSQSCCTGLRGNVSQTGTIDLTDLSLLIGYLTVPGVTLPCPEAANVSGTGTIDLTDLSMLIGYLTVQGFVIPPCPADTGLMDPAARMAAVSAVEDHMDSLLSLPTATFNQRVLSFIQGRPEFEASGIDPSGNNVWARFTDGVMYMVAGSFGALDDSLPGEVLPPDTMPIAPPLTPEQRDALRAMRGSTAKPAAFDDLPFSGRYRVIQTVGSAFQSAGTTTSRLRSWLSANGYVNAGSGASVEELRSIGDEGVIFYVGHGGAGVQPNGNLDYGIWSSNLANIGNVSAYASDLRNGRLCLLSAPKDTNAAGVAFAETHYGITSRFISYYWWDLPPNAMVVITACASDSVGAFRSAIQAKGGPAYFGWTQTLDCKGGCYAAEFLIDRLLGANKAFPRENPEQRPFDVSKVFADLQSRNFHVQPGGDGVNTFSTTMRYHPGSSNFGLLAPSIQFMDLYAVTDTLTINGIFGEDPGDNGEVTVNGTQLTISSWTPTVIKCHLPVRGPGSSGPVIVQKKAPNGSDFRKSNVVNISEWEGTFTQTREEEGTLKLTAAYDFRIRADIHSHRDEPGETPFKPITPFYQEQDATATWEVGGVADWDQPNSDMHYHHVWAGGGDLPLFDSTNPFGVNFFHYTGSVDADQMRITLANGALIVNGWTITETVSWPEGSDVSSWPGAWATTMDTELYDETGMYWYYTISMDNDYNIPASSRTAQNFIHFTDFDPSVPVQLKIEWPTIQVQYAPDKNEAQ